MSKMITQVWVAETNAKNLLYALTKQANFETAMAAIEMLRHTQQALLASCEIQQQPIQQVNLAFESTPALEEAFVLFHWWRHHGLFAVTMNEGSLELIFHFEADVTIATETLQQALANLKQEHEKGEFNHPAPSAAMAIPRHLRNI